jgi:PAS domain S-box-containing protein
MNSIKILYVDSDVNYGQNFLLKLLSENYDVKYTSTYKNALIESSFHHPDILITEAQLEDESGINLIQKIKNQNPNIKTIIITNNSNKDVLMEAIKVKVDEFIFKDTVFSEIIQKLKKLEITKKDIKKDIEKKDISYDLGKHHIYNGLNIITAEEKTILLTSQENNLIKLLIEAKGSCVPYEIIQSSISKNIISLDTIRTVIRKIRKKSFNEIIQNQSGIGYKISWDSPDSKTILTNDYIQIKAKILILKGDNKKNELLSYKLERFGFKCDSAFTLAQAKDSVKVNKYDYIIVDLNLPDGEGIDFIRKFDELYSTKIIVLSNSDDVHYKDYLYFKGVLDYIIDIKDEDALSNYIYKTIYKVEHNIKYNNILIIEQSKKTCEQIKDLLLPRNYNVDIINKLEEGFDLVKAKSYSLIIIDINYDKCFEFIQSIKQKISKGINFFVLSDSNRSYATVRESYLNGAAECLRKPIFADEFILKVDQHVDTTKLIFELSENKKILNNYKKIVDQSAIISKTNARGIITYVNPIFSNLSGYSEEELIGKAHSIIRHPDSSRELFEDMWNTIKYEKEIWTGVLKNRTKDGNTYYVQTSIMPIMDEEGEIEEFIALRNDITNIYKTV